jgi:hypothetical protein
MARKNRAASVPETLIGGPAMGRDRPGVWEPGSSGFEVQIQVDRFSAG